MKFQFESWSEFKRKAAQYYSLDPTAKEITYMYATQSSTTLTISEAVSQFINNVQDNTPFTVKEITQSLRDRSNNGEITLSSIPVNPRTSAYQSAVTGVFERQTVHYSVVRDIFRQLLDNDFTNVTWDVDPLGMYRIYRKNAPTQTSGFIQVLGDSPQPATTITTTNTLSSPNIAPLAAPTYTTKSLAEGVLDGTVSHVYKVELNGNYLDIDGESTFLDKRKAEIAVINKLSKVLDGTDKQLRKEMTSLVRQGKLQFVKERV